MTPPDIKDIEAITKLVDKDGYDPEDLVAVLHALNAIKRNNKKKEEEEAKQENKIFLDKEFVYETREDVYIYRDNRTKKKGYYIRIYDAKKRSHWSKSLKTTNRLQAMTLAEQIYAERKGRMAIGVRPVSITAKDLVKLYQQERRKELTNIPHQGITPKSLDKLCSDIKHWEKYISAKGYTNTNLEDIPRELGQQFGLWIKEQKKANGKDKQARNNYTINQTIAAVKKMYRTVGIDQNYITLAELPNFKYLKVNRENKPSRDVLTRDEFTAVSKWIQYHYCNEKGIDENEFIKRRVYGLVFTMHHYMGCRPKEMLAMKWSDISINRNDDKRGKEVNRLIHIPAENSKTGRSRDIISPIAPQLARLVKWYRKLGFEVNEKSDQFVFPRLTLSSLNKNIPTSDVAWSKRLKKVIEGADKDGFIELNGRVITNYSARHHHITEAIMRGVDIYDISLNCGTDINYIQKTYSHVTVQMRSKDITKGLGVHRLYEPITE